MANMNSRTLHKRREKQFKKLKRTHIWPSIVFFVLSIIVAVIAFQIFTQLIIEYFMQERLMTADNEAVHIAKLIEDAKTPEEVNAVMEFLAKDANPEDAVYIYEDKKGSEECILTGFGGDTFNIETGRILAATQNLAYEDKNTMITFLKGDSLSSSTFLEYFWKDDNIRLFTLLLDGEDLTTLLTPSYSNQEPFLKQSYWIGIVMPDRRIVLVKKQMGFYLRDFFLSLLVGGATVAIMLFPLIFLFLNVVSNLRNQGRITKMLYTDTVTGGKNWLYFEHYAYKQLDASRNARKTYAFVDLSLEKYRNYCTFHGVHEGEQLLTKINQHINACLAKSELCAHNDNGNFALLLKCRDIETCTDWVHALVRELPGLVRHDSLIFHAGVYFNEPEKTSDGRIIRRQDVDIPGDYNRASAARGSIKDENNSDVAVFNDILLEAQLWEHKVEEKMQAALNNEEFQVYIQPKYNPVTEQLAGAEALVRWINEEDGFISPGRFIPIFEKNGFITKLDDYMISHVAKLQAKWLSEGKQVVPVSVNISRAHFANPTLAEHLCQLVDVYNVPHHLIEIELTESAFFDDRAALLSTVEKLKALHFDVSMDDFGAGYSSLNSLKDLPLDVLKLDADFFRGESEEGRGEIVVSQAIHLAKMLNMKIVAEGVEKKNQVDFLASQECDMIQGYYYAKPMPADEYAERLSPYGTVATAPPAAASEETPVTEPAEEPTEETPVTEPAEEPTEEVVQSSL